MFVLEGGSLVNQVGIYDDNWCNPLVNITIKAEKEITYGMAEVWTNVIKDSDAVTKMIIRSNEKNHISSDMHPERVSLIFFNCGAKAGDNIVIEMLCDARADSDNEDIRSLSFILNKLVFSN